MCEGRSFEEIDSMTLFDLQMMNVYRSVHPSLEDLVSMIATQFGYTPPSVKKEITVESLYDPRADIKAAFANAKFSSADGISNVF